MLGLFEIHFQFGGCVCEIKQPFLGAEFGDLGLWVFGLFLYFFFPCNFGAFELLPSSASSTEQGGQHLGTACRAEPPAQRLQP